MSQSGKYMSSMRRLKLGQRGLEVSEMCLGTMYMGTSLPKEQSYAVLDAYLEAGGNFLDTANIYAFWAKDGRGGESEAMLGAWIHDRGVRAEVIVATKVGGGGMAGVDPGLRAAQIVKGCEQSLRRMRLEMIDLYFSHLDFRDIPLEETLEAFDKLARQGKIRGIGASNHAAWRLAQARGVSRAHGWAEYCCVQQRHSYLRPVPGAGFFPQLPVTEDMLDYCRTESVPIMAYTPLLGGCYARGEERLPSQYHGVDTQLRLSAVRELAKELDVSPNQVVLAWMTQGTPKVIPIVATGSVEHLRENLAASEVRLSAEAMERLDRAGACQERNLILIGESSTWAGSAKNC